MATVNFSRVSSSVALAAGATLLVATLAACGSDSDSAASSTSTSSATTPADPFSVTETQTPTETPGPAAASTCPTAAPANGGTPEWTLPGATGSVAVTGSTDATAPNIKVETPFSVTETQVHTLQAGEGPVVADTATVSVCYMGVNGRDGSVFDSSYERGAPEEFPLPGLWPASKRPSQGRKSDPRSLSR